MSEDTDYMNIQMSSDDRYYMIDEKVQNIIDSTNTVSKIKKSFINILLKNENMLLKFYDEYGWLFFYGQWGVFNTEDRLRYIIAQIDIDELADFFIII